ncbi:hypothetical protein V8C86DRAFT_2635135 [Haematococcus lacustris]
MAAARRVMLPLLPPMPRATPSCYRLLTLFIATAHAACCGQLLPTADLVTPGCCPSVRPTAPHCLGCNAYGCCRTRQVHSCKLAVGWLVKLES